MKKTSTIEHLRGLAQFAEVNVKIEKLNSQGAYTIKQYDFDDLNLLVPVLRAHGYIVHISENSMPYIRKAA